MNDAAAASSGTAPVTAMVSGYRRVDALLHALAVIGRTRPRPAEIIVHIDAHEIACAQAVRTAYPDVTVILSDDAVGPGGGRNKAAARAAEPILASFDDDSYPLDEDYFARVTDLFARFPEADVLAATLFHRHEPIRPAAWTGRWAADFVGGGCAYRREAFLRVGGYVPLVTAYNMEEVDFSLRLHAGGGRVLATEWLRVFHDTDLSHHASARVTAASIANLALLAYLRYPVWLWPIGLWQVASRVFWLLTHGRRAGVVKGIADIPSTLAGHADQVGRLPGGAVLAYLAGRRRHQPAAFGDGA